MEFTNNDLKKKRGLGLNLNQTRKIQDSFFGNIDPNTSYTTNNQTFFHASKAGINVSKSSVCKLNTLGGVGLSMISMVDPDENYVESEGFAVWSDPKFLYQIGKITSEMFMEEGLVCLDDFLNILDVRRMDLEGKERGKAKFLAAVIFFKNNEFREA